MNKDERLTFEEIHEFMNTQGFSDVDFANFLGVTIQAVKLWKTDDRPFSVTNSRLIKLFIKYPTLIREFGKL